MKATQIIPKPAPIQVTLELTHEEASVLKEAMNQCWNERDQSERRQEYSDFRYTVWQALAEAGVQYREGVKP
jgi:cation transport regulator ChaB